LTQRRKLKGRDLTLMTLLRRNVLVISGVMKMKMPEGVLMMTRPTWLFADAFEVLHEGRWLGKQSFSRMPNKREWW